MNALQKHLRRIAVLGGQATFKKHGRKHYKKLSMLGNAAKRK